MAGLVERGLPPHAAQAMLGVFLASRRGEFAAVDPTLEGLLGRPPRSLRQELAEHLSG